MGKVQGPDISEERTEAGTENAEVKAQMTGEGPAHALPYLGI